MSLNWEEVVAYAQGVASDEVKARIEANAKALGAAIRLTRLAEIRQDAPPDLWLDRAKALIPQRETAQQPIIGRLAFQSSGVGLRSTATAVELQFEADDIVVDLRIEPDRDKSKEIVVGLVTGRISCPYRVGVGGTWLTWTDDEGLFELTKKVSDRSLTLFDPMKTETITLELPWVQS
jgi:hypothetical protein